MLRETEFFTLSSLYNMPMRILVKKKKHPKIRLLKIRVSIPLLWGVMLRWRFAPPLVFHIKRIPITIQISYSGTEMYKSVRLTQKRWCWMKLLNLHTSFWACDIWRLQNMEFSFTFSKKRGWKRRRDINVKGRKSAWRGQHLWWGRLGWGAADALLYCKGSPSNAAGFSLIILLSFDELLALTRTGSLWHSLPTSFLCTNRIQKTLRSWSH